VQLNRGYDYVMLRGGLSGSVALEPVGANRTRLRFREAFHMTTPILRWFEGPIYRFINRKNEESMRGASEWLARHPEFRPDLIDGDERSRVQSPESRVLRDVASQRQEREPGTQDSGPGTS